MEQNLYIEDRKTGERGCKADKTAVTMPNDFR